MLKKFELTRDNYQYLFNNATDAMWVHDMAGSILVANNASGRLTGYTHEELIRLNVVKFLTPELLGAARDIKGKLLKGEPFEQPYEQRLMRKDGAVRIVQMATSLVKTDGEVLGFLNVARDVTEEKRAEEMLARIVDGSPIPAFVINREHNVTHWNKALAALSGISQAEIIGRDRQGRAFYNEDRPTLADLIVDGASIDGIETYYGGKYRKSALIEGAYEAEDFFPNLGEHGRWLHFTASPIMSDGGEMAGAIETMQDISEEKQLQESLRFYVQNITRAQEDERKRIARELHDDVAPPLLLLIQRLDSATTDTRNRLPAPLEEMLEKLRLQAIDSLEGVRRCAQDLRPPILDDFGLIPALQWVAEGLEKHYGIKVRVETSGELVGLSDEVQVLLFRIAQEALSNVRKHSGAAAAVVKLESGDREVRISIIDNGCGFVLPAQAGAFGEDGKLGITGMHERALLLGGTLKVKSAPGKGTEVVVSVPLPPAAPPG
ncbi:MAG: PAS domain S-box protein [Chloroflexota bacterium]